MFGREEIQYNHNLGIFIIFMQSMAKSGIGVGVAGHISTPRDLGYDAG